MNQTRDERIERMVREHSRFAFQVAYSVLRNAADAEDVVQECFLKLYKSSRLEDIADERAFLARSVWRSAVTRASKRKDVREEDSTANLVDNDPSPERLAVEKDRDALIRKMIAALPADLRNPLLLSAINGMNSREIGLVLEIPEGTVRTRLMRAREVLKQRLTALMEYRDGRARR